MSIKLEDYGYLLPKERIALYPAKEREDARLMVLDRKKEELKDGRFGGLASYFDDGDVLVLNDTRVVPARLFGTLEKGGETEFLFCGMADGGNARMMVRGLKKLEPGDRINFGNDLKGVFIDRDGDMGLVRMEKGEEDIDGWLNRFGHIPLPPYIDRPDEPLDRRRYQTVFASGGRSIAAPTAGLHFTIPLMTRIQNKGVKTLDIALEVGTGTFRPVTEEDITKHRLDPETADVPKEVYDQLIRTKKNGGRVIAVGTTTTRALETAARKGGGFKGPTDLFIYPGFEFKMVDALVTNFHLPRSSLLMLVCAFAGREKVLHAYGEAVERVYRFYSYGDAMLIL